MRLKEQARMREKRVEECERVCVCLSLSATVRFQKFDRTDGEDFLVSGEKEMGRPVFTPTLLNHNPKDPRAKPSPSILIGACFFSTRAS
jgi:hypothetical protein